MPTPSILSENFIIGKTYPMMIKNVLIDKAETDREDRTASSHNSIDQTQPLLEIMPKDGERRCVNQRGSCSEHEAIG